MFLYNNMSSLPYAQNQRHMPRLPLRPLLCNFCTNLCQRGNNYLTLKCFESGGNVQNRVASRPLRPECQESPSPVAPVELGGLNEPSRKKLAQQLDFTWCLNPEDASLKAVYF